MMMMMIEFDEFSLFEFLIVMFLTLYDDVF